MKKNRFQIREQFYLDEKPFRIISGSIHYFRVVPQYWRDRLQKLREMGCNTVETYVPWNLHEPRRGEFCFEGMLDLKQFLKTAQELGLWAIVRPSPYICAEWEFGGLPAWLLAEDGMRLRCSYLPFLNAVNSYYKALFNVLAPLQIDNGGPVILMQVENEYGAFGDEKAYLEALRGSMKVNGVTVPLLTSDGPWGDYLACGSLPGTLTTANFGSKTAEHFPVLKKYTDGKPLMCMEFWVGWFDAWGDEKHHTTDPNECAKDLDAILSSGGSVNFYMFHGGTNFGLMNGSNYDGHLMPDVTSYDYDAPLSENGKITPKYLALRETIGKYAFLPPLAGSSDIKTYASGVLNVTDRVSLFSVLEEISSSTENPWPLSMEKLGQSYGYTLYRSEQRKDVPVEKIMLLGANDRAQIFFDEKPFLTLFDRDLEKEHAIAPALEGVSQLDILTENMGRVNYGPKMTYQRKGIDGAVLVNGHGHAGWKMFCLPMDAEMCAKLDFSKEYREGQPSFYRVEFPVTATEDTFLDMSGWGKGCVLLNGFNLGRYWEKGPQRRLYVPAPLLRQGTNELVIFETEGKAADSVSFEAEPALG